MIVDPDGLPVVGVKVTAGYEHARTDTQGVFVIEGLAEEEHVLHFDQVPERFLAPSSGRLFAEPGGGPLRRFVLRHRARLEGTVAPVGTGAPTEWIVVVDPAWHWAPHAEVRDGRLAFERLVGGHEEWVLAWCPEAPGWSAATKVRIEPIGTTRVDFAPRGPGTIVGRVVWRGPAPDRLWVHAGRWQYDRRSAEVRADGTFELTGVPVGRARVSAGGAFAEVEVETGRTSRVDLVLDEEGATLEGIVVDAAGGPLALANVELIRVGTDEREGAHTDKEGRFVARGLEGGRWRLHARGDRLVSPSVELTVPVLSGELRLVCGPSPRLLVRVVDEVGRPVPAARLNLRRREERHARLVPTTDAAGRIELDSHLVPGPIGIDLDEVFDGSAELLERVARLRGVRATRCEPVKVELRPGESSEATLRVVDLP